MEERSSSTQLPPVRRVKRRQWGRLLARILCVLFAVTGLVPVGLGLLVRTPWARGIATAETRKLLAGMGIHATYGLELRLWPLSVTLHDIRVEASDGGTPFLTARRAAARPRIFGLLAGKVVIDQIEVEGPKARVVLKDGKLQNLALDLPKSESKGPEKPPFSVVSMSEGEVDLEVDGIGVKAFEIDADVTTDDDGSGGSAFEIALRTAEARSRIARSLKNGETSIDEDTLCRVDGRVRIEPKRVLVRRFVAHGAVDFDPAEGTHQPCSISKDDKRYVEVALGHFSVVLPTDEEKLPNLEGHARVRAPLALLGRLPDGPDADGWALVDAELRYTPETPIPDLAGRIEGKGIRIDHYSFARAFKSEIAVRRSVVTSPLTTLEIADGVAEIRDVEVQPLAKGIPLKVGRLDVNGASFTSLMKDLGVSQHPHVTWDLREVHSTGWKGTIEPLSFNADLVAHTYDFAVFDAPVDSPTKVRATGVKEGHLQGRVAVTPTGLEFQNITLHTTKSVATGVLVSIGFHEVIRVEVPQSKIDLSDLSPLGAVVMSGVADAKVSVTGEFGSPQIKGETSIENFAIADIPFGNVTQASVTADISKYQVDLRDVRAVKNKSTYELTTGRLDFNGPASMTMDGQIASKSLDIRDFFAMFKLEDDPRFQEIEGVVETNARMHLALGGPEDVCKGGFLEVQATTNARNVNLLGEKFDEGHADFEYRWHDRLAGVDGADVDVRSLSLTKVKKDRGSIGSVLGSLSVHRGGNLRGSFVVQGFPLARTDALGAAAKYVEGSASGVARIAGTLADFQLDADLNTTPVRVLGSPFPGSDIHVEMTQRSKPPKIVGKTPCDAPVTAPFDKEAYLKDTSSQGDWKIDGALFGGQIKLTNLVMTRTKAPLVTGKVDFARFDLGPVGKILVPVTEASEIPSPSLGGEITGELSLEKIAVDDLAHAKARFAPTTLRLTRGGQKIELRPGGGVVFVLADDKVDVPQVTFDLAAANGFKGAFAVKGSVGKVTRGGDLSLEAELSPIDLGILVGMVPRVTHALGTLSGSVKVKGSPSQPDLDGKLIVRGGELGVKGLPSAITEVEIDIEADENEARVTRAKGHLLGGEVTATARMPLKGGQFGTASATVTGRQLYVAPADGVRATLDADLELTFNPNASTTAARLPFVGGEVTVTSFEYSRPITIDLTGFKGGARRTVIEAYDPSQDAIAFGFAVRSRVPLRIRNNLIDAQLQIDPRGINVTGTNQRIGLRGEMSTVAGGRFRVFANDFEVQKGTIKFDDPTRIAPRLDITAVTEYRRFSSTVASSSTGGGVGGAVAAGNVSSGGGRGSGLWRITLHAYGDLDDPHADLTSDPALSQEDIFFLLTIGLTRAEVDQVRAGSVYASAAFEAIGTVSGADRAVKTAIPVIDDFRFGSAYSPRTGRTEPQVTLGRRLTDNVRANVSTGLTEDRQLRSAVEWRLSRPLSVQTSYDNVTTVSSGNVGNFGLDFRWRLEFD